MACKPFETLVERDFQTLWHPFTDSAKREPPIHISRGQGARLYTPSGESYIDGISSWWTNLHGHAHPYIAEQIAHQARELEHVIFTDFTHVPAVNYATRLLQHVPQNLSRVFYSDNGSTAVETALKMAIQFWENQATAKKKILSFKGGYHGDTFGAMSGSGKNAFNHPFWPFLFEVISIDPPLVGNEEISLQQMREALKTEDVLCFLYEPLIQGACGMRVHSSLGLEALLKLAKSHDVVLIADEVLTGFGRCGPLFASSCMQTPPDLMALSKGITGGFLPLGATLSSEKIYEAFHGKALLHGHSYTGNPIACRAACASLDLLERQECTLARECIHNLHTQFVSKWKGHSRLKRLEVLGTFLIVEYHSNPPSRTFFHSEYIILRPLGNAVYVLPPYCITQEELDQIYRSLEKTWTL
jgi:adenosylmethionine-8-amino-7-oxononanoate aminotransferase